MREKYRRILSMASLSEVENPWKGISMNRCIVLALLIVVLISGVEMAQESVQPIFDVAANAEGMNEFEAAWWDLRRLWNLQGTEFEDEEKPESKNPRKRENPQKNLLKGRD